ncbi:MAG: carbohydrate kinase family protein [Candidatus Daviesbacteria bacterium]|nr:carbohydrate kinase family protein [Candidatus Daviesbacteria bacterium]
MFDLISIGDARIDNFVHLPKAHISCTLNKESCELCLNYGDKIPIDDVKSLTAGNNNNNAIGASRLKMKTALYGNIGGDANGRMILDHLKAEGVDTRYMVVNKDIATEQSIVINYQGERTILVYHYPWDYNLPDLDRTKWVYFSSVSFSFPKTLLVSQIEQYIERTGTNLVYTPGTHQLNFGVKKYPKLLSLTKVLIVNKEEAKKILGIDEDKKVEIKKLLSGLADLGPGMVVVTDGGEGSYGFDGEKFFQLGLFPAELLEMTGAGDGYATGLVAGLFHGKDLKEAMRWGAANGAAVVEKIGPQAGLLTLNQMQDRLKTNCKIVAKEI